MASNDGWEDVPVDSAHGWEDVPVAPAAQVPPVIRGPGRAPSEAGAGDIGGAATLGAHFVRHAPYGLGDKLTAAMQALQDVHHDKTGKVKFSDAYTRDLAFNDQALEAADKLHPVERWLGNGLGVATSIAVPAGAAGLARAGLLGRGALAANAARGAAQTLPQLAWRGTKSGAVLGGLGGFGASRADTLGGTALDTGAGVLGGTALGAAAPYVADVAGRGAGYLGDKLRDAAGWLKVNTLHPTPTLGEAMEEIPGGRVGVGRELLKRNIGGLTKHGTAAQLAKAAKAAGGDVNRVAQAYDAAGGAPVDLTGPIDASLVHAADLNRDPLTREAGNKLAGVAGEYRQTYATPASAVEALALKRRIGDAAYKHTISTEPVAGQYGEHLAKLERGVDSTMDSALGPDFEAANTASRRLYKAKDAAERVAARTHSNHVLGLIPMALGAGGYAAHGAEGGAAAALGSMLLSKYGSQVGARTLYGLGGGLEALAPLLPKATAPGVTEAAREELTPQLSRLFQTNPAAAQQMAQAEALRRRNALATLEAPP